MHVISLSLGVQAGSMTRCRCPSELRSCTTKLGAKAILSLSLSHATRLSLREPAHLQAWVPDQAYLAQLVDGHVVQDCHVHHWPRHVVHVMFCSAGVVGGVRLV